MFSDHVLRGVLGRLPSDGSGQHTTTTSGPRQPDDRRTHVPEGAEGHPDLDRPGSDRHRVCVLHRLLLPQLSARARRQARTAEEARGYVSRTGTRGEGHHGGFERFARWRGEAREDFRDFVVTKLA